MPSYTFFCYKCNQKFEIISSIRDYSDQQMCPTCNNKENVMRCYIEDVSTLNSSIKKSDTELKTVGDLANRNRDRMSEGQKEELYTKHNEYKEQSPTKTLPKGFERLSKQPKTKWI
jgi:putative FmdB family regulatory protein